MRGLRLAEPQLTDPPTHPSILLQPSVLKEHFPWSLALRYPHGHHFFQASLPGLAWESISIVPCASSCSMHLDLVWLLQHHLTPCSAPKSLFPFCLSPCPEATSLFLLETNSLLTLTGFHVSQGSTLAGRPLQLLEGDSQAVANTGCQDSWNCQNASYFMDRPGST